MSTVLLIIQLIISIILTGLILIQRSEGGALGIGGGGGGGLMSGRSATTSIARMTGILGAAFIVNCLILSVVYQVENRDNLIIDDEAVASQPAEPTVSTPVTAETATEVLTPSADSSETSVPLVDDSVAEETGSEQDE